MEAESVSLKLETLVSFPAPVTACSSDIVLGPDGSESEFKIETESGFEGAIEIGNSLIDPAFGWNCTSEPMQEALRIELIVQKLLFYMDFETLKSARSVSRHWAYLASKELQKRSTINLHYGLGKRSLHYKMWYKALPCYITNNTLNELVELLETKTAIDSNFVSALEFPCTSFEFYDFQKRSHWLHNYSAAIRRFLSLHGTHITKLNIGTHFVTDSDWDNEKALSQLRTLFKESGENSVKLLPCLRVFKMPSSFHRGIFEGIYNEAPNLHEIELSLKYVPYVFERPNQLQLLKETDALIFSEKDEAYIEIMTVLGSGKHGLLDLREFVFNIVYFHDLSIWPRMRDALNSMLTSTYVTIETLIFNKDLADLGIDVPSSMPPCARRNGDDFRFERMNTDPKEIPQ